MKYIIFLILLISIAIIYFYSNKKIGLLRNQILALKRQNSTLKSDIAKLNTTPSTYKNIITIPIIPQNTSGIIKKSAQIYIGPLNGLPIIYTTNVNMEVKIFDKVQSNNEIWYYIQLPTESEVNSRGWVKGNCFTTFGNSFSNNIVKHF